MSIKIYIYIAWNEKGIILQIKWASHNKHLISISHTCPILILSHIIRSKLPIFSNSSLTYTFCQQILFVPLSKYIQKLSTPTTFTLALGTIISFLTCCLFMGLQLLILSHPMIYFLNISQSGLLKHESIHISPILKTSSVFPYPSAHDLPSVTSDSPLHSLSLPLMDFPPVTMFSSGLWAFATSCCLWNHFSQR